MGKVGEIVDGKYVAAKKATPVQRESFESMLESRQPPGLRTGNEFFKGKAQGQQFAHTPKMGDMYAEEAKRQGVSITGKVYSHQLADYAGDPSAWVSDASDFASIARRKGAGCAPLGITGTKIQEPDVPLAEDIIVDEIKDRIEEDPSLNTRKKIAELREQVIDEHTPYWAK